MMFTLSWYKIILYLQATTTTFHLQAKVHLNIEYTSSCIARYTRVLSSCEFFLLQRFHFTLLDFYTPSSRKNLEMKLMQYLLKYFVWFFICMRPMNLKSSLIFSLTSIFCLGIILKDAFWAFELFTNQNVIRIYIGI